MKFSPKMIINAMIDFDLMVKNILWEEATSGDVGGGEEEETKGLFGFFVTGSPKPYTVLQNLWKTSFKLFPFPSEPDVNQICFGVISSLPRVTKDSDKFPNFESIFPLIDLAAQLYEQNFKGKSNALPEATKKTFDAFLQNLNKQISNSKDNLKPIDYVASHPWVQTLKSDFLQAGKEEIGKIRFESLGPELSIYQAMMNILAFRKKAISLKLPGPLKTLSGEGIVNKILLEPWSVVSGKFVINDEKMRAIYDDLTVQQMVNFSLACYKLYNQQLSVNIQTDVTDPGYTAQRYALFMGAKGASQFQWLAKGQTAAIIESFKDLFESLNEEFLSEEETRTNKEVTDALKRRYQKERVLKASLASSAGNRSSKFKEFEASTPKIKAFETKAGMGTFVYNIGKLKEASATFRIDEATEVINQLKSFANYIKTTEFDIIKTLNNVQNAAKGLSFGAKMMGS